MLYCCKERSIRVSVYPPPHMSCHDKYTDHMEEEVGIIICISLLCGGTHIDTYSDQCFQVTKVTMISDYKLHSYCEMSFL